uniref:CCHC-type domain-containing protein n=1 Tax=Amphimedon queenslandica TaxID=400682 RepID=A0A1X7TMX5_AMPQE
TTNTTTQSLAATKPICPRCGTAGHLATVCRFKEAFCHHCGKKGHLLNVCNSKRTQTSTDSAKPVNSKTTVGT